MSYGTSASNGRFASATASTHHVVEHRFGQLAGERVLLAGVVGAQQCRTTRHLDRDPMTESRAGSNGVVTTERGEGEPTEAHDDSRFEEVELPDEERSAGVSLSQGRLVVRRGAAYGGTDPHARQLQAVVDAHGLRSVGQPGAVQRPKQPVTAAIAGEHASRAVGTVRRGSQADHDNLRCRIAEARHRPAPVGVAGERGPFLRGDPLTPLDEPRASPTPDDLAANDTSESTRRRYGGQWGADHPGPCSRGQWGVDHPGTPVAPLTEERISCVG